MRVNHIHIPRTAGTAIRGHLRAHVPHLSSAHKWWDDLDEEVDTIQFIVLREPTERVISLYHYIRSNPNHDRQATFQAHSLRELLDEPDVGSYRLSNAQTRLLRGPGAASREITQDDAESVWRRLTRPDVLAVALDRLDEGLAVLGQRLGVPIPPMTTRMINTVEHEPVDRSTARTIRRLNQWDYLLFGRVLARDPA